MQIEPIGRLRTCFGEKFAVPRQPGLCPSAWGRLEFLDGYQDPDLVRGLEGFSHVWLIFQFHLTVDRGWSPTVRPPRLGGNQKVGVLGSRSTFRPNGLGLSLVKLERVEWVAGETVLHLGGVDLVDGTPVFDVKPYLPYAEAPDGAFGGYADKAPNRLQVEGLEHLKGMGERERQVVEEVLSLDPRPAGGRAEPGRIHGALLCGRNVRFQIDNGVCRIVAVEPVDLQD
ncbi:tRNA (N6-threonylcarbamoyladenosine(37)-N6)-methyltransferase TrmO [Haloferula rosea]|uniref:tRNA (N6-threonylcarbamoyladenosine(37)-N6)-methyltransferase TrmO n=1 Tax=Haloferula rosea TaxID=490093 RepID=UPI002D7FEA95|nr:tRNA (N6-threonylcarbamoyladenosine(37)-N6)-methyltransferase TrmO [Haloferula rosea]